MRWDSVRTPGKYLRAVALASTVVELELQALAPCSRRTGRASRPRARRRGSRKRTRPPTTVEDGACARMPAERMAPAPELLELRVPPLRRREAATASFVDAVRHRWDHLYRREVLGKLVIHPGRVVAEVAVLGQLERRDDLVEVGCVDRGVLHEERVEEARDAKTRRSGRGARQAPSLCSTRRPAR